MNGSRDPNGQNPRRRITGRNTLISSGIAVAAVASALAVVKMQPVQLLGMAILYAMLARFFLTRIGRRR